MTGSARPTCYRCRRPQPRCICASIPRVDNRTAVTVLQHPRERFHPFGTARIVELGLRRCELHVAWGDADKDVHRELGLPPGTALLYPGEGALELGQLPADERPAGLLVLDGTWWHAHCLYRDNPWLKDLPHYALPSQGPSRYRIRREPEAHCLSTVEAVVRALQILEPETNGLDALLGSFDAMVDAQVGEERKGQGPPRRKRPRQRPSRAVPPALAREYERLWVVYGESAQLHSRAHPEQRELLQWTAVQPASGQTFHSMVSPSLRQPSAEHLRRLDLDSDVMESAPDMDEFLRRWQRCAGPAPLLAAWNQSTLRLFAEVGGDTSNSLQLKAAYCNVRKEREGRCGTLEEVIAREQLRPAPEAVPGRAAQRLANAASLAKLLRDHAAG